MRASATIGPLGLLLPPPAAVVGARGFEPPTSCSQSRCATRLRHAPGRRWGVCSRSRPDVQPGEGRLADAAARAEIALQQLEDATQQIAVVERTRDEIVAIALRPPDAAVKIAD